MTTKQIRKKFRYITIVNFGQGSHVVGYQVTMKKQADGKTLATGNPRKFALSSNLNSLVKKISKWKNRGEGYSLISFKNEKMVMEFKKFGIPTNPNKKKKSKTTNKGIVVPTPMGDVQKNKSGGWYYINGSMKGKFASNDYVQTYLEN